MTNNNRPLSRRKTARITVAVIILVWATQTMLHQWGFGAEVPMKDAPEGSFGTERFLLSDSASHPATLELRADASVVGPEVKLRQVCRWNDADTQSLEP